MCYNQAMKSLDELRALPLFNLFTVVEGVHPETGEPCKMVRTNQTQIQVLADIEEYPIQFPDTDGSPMRVVNTTNGLMKMHV